MSAPAENGRAIVAASSSSAVHYYARPDARPVFGTARAGDLAGIACGRRVADPSRWTADHAAVTCDECRMAARFARDRRRYRARLSEARR